MHILTDEQIEQTLHDLNVAWSAIPGQGLVRVYDTKSFLDGMRLVAKIATIADELDHFPNVNLSPNEVQVTLVSPKEGGVTEADVKLAKAIDEI